MAVASLDGRALLFDLQSGQSTLLHQGSVPLLCVALGPETGQMLLGGEDGSVRRVGMNSAGPQTARFPSAVVAAAWFDAGRSWIIGCRHGELLMLDENLAVQARLGLEAPLSDFELGRADEGHLLVLAVQQPRLATLHVSTNPWGFHLANSMEVPHGNSLAAGIHSVCFGDTCDEVYALDDIGRLIHWDRRQGRIRGIEQVLSNEQLLKSVERRGAAHGWPIPECLRKSGVVAAGSKPGQIITAPRDMTALVWQAAPVELTRQISLETAALVCFDPQLSDVLWALSADGRLSAFDVAAIPPVCFATAQAHEGRGVAMTGSTNGTVLTTGSEGEIRSWRLEDTRIARGAVHWRHPRPLRSLAAGPRGNWIAGVDERSRLTVWPARGGPPEFSAALSEEAAPLSGCIAFNTDGSKLAACGAGATCVVFSIDPFERLNEEPQLAGRGGVALAWHPRDPNMLLAADDYPRYAPWPRDPTIIPEMGIGFRPHACRKIVAPPGGRRWFLLEESGEVLICDSEGTGLLWSFPTPPGGYDLALDRDGNRLAVSHASGVISVVESKLPGTPLIKQETPPASDWRESRLVETFPGLMRWTSHGMAMDSQGCMHLLACVGPRAAARLIYVKGSFENNTPETVDNLGPESEEALCLAMEQDQPVAVYRRRDARGSIDQAVLCVARRKGTHQWATEVLTTPGNAGYYPLARVQHGRVQEVLHFSFSGYELMQTVRESAGWQSRPIGHQGDGFRILGPCGNALPTRFGFRANRFNADAAPPLFGCWDGRELIREVIDPSCDQLKAFASRDDSSIVAALLLDRSVPRYRYLLARRTSKGIWHSVPFPGDSLGIEMRIDRKNRIHVLTREANGEIVLWILRDNAWFREVVTAIGVKKLVNLALLADSSDRSIVVVGVADDANVSSISIWRKSN